ncbi:MAG: anti-sigma factor family protein [Armatimonadota bacterium]
MTDECRKFSLQLHEWFEGCADGETNLLVQWHLRNCAQCQRLLIEWQTVADEVKASLSIPAPKGFEMRLRQRLCAPQLISWNELTVSWVLTASGASIASFWLGTSLSEILRSIPQWMFGIVGWSTLPAQWLQQLWELVSRFA